MKTIAVVLLAFILLATTTAHAAVVFIDRLVYDYVPCGPDLRGDTCQFVDMDGDGTRDFYFAAAIGNGAYLIPLGDNRVLSNPVIAPGGLGRYTVAMTGGELLGVTPFAGFWMGRLDYFDNTDQGSLIYACFGERGGGNPPVCISTIESGFFSTNYLGLEFWSGGGLHYGWINVYVLGLGGTHDVVINGWAYESDAGQSLAAGQVPEPGMGSLALLAGAALCRRRR